MAISSFNTSAPGQGASDASVTVTTEDDAAAQRAGASLGDRLSCIFSSLEAGGYAALSGTCKELGDWSCRELGVLIEQFYQSRCRLLLASDTKRHLFKSFGIECPEGGAASPEQMEAIVRRVRGVLYSLHAFSKNSPEVALPRDFPKFLLSMQMAERLVMGRPPEQLQALLSVAYDCSLYTIFASHAKIAPDIAQYAHSSSARPAISLAAATQAIQRWLRTEAARNVGKIAPPQKALACLPAEIGYLSGLRELRLGGQWLTTLPAELGRLTRLHVLSLGRNQYKEIPSWVGQLTELHVLYLGSNRLNGAPSWIGQLSQLQALDLKGAQLKEIPAWIGQLSQLRVLDLQDNQLTSFQLAASQLPKLVDLCLGGNRLNGAPSWIGQLSQLQILDLKGAQLKEIPAWIGQLSQLRILDLQGNQLTSFQLAASQLPKLEDLFLGRNRFNEVPSWIGQLSKLKTLDMGANQLTAFLPDGWLASNIEELFLERNQLVTLPEWLGQAGTLKDLNVSYNPLNTIPGGITRLPRLHQLTVDEGQYAAARAQLDGAKERGVALLVCPAKDSFIAFFPK